MCTVTWQREEGAYLLYCNRDERKTRSLSAAPRMMSRHPVPLRANDVEVPADFGFSLATLRYQREAA
jgi:hypothetical protein